MSTEDERRPLLSSSTRSRAASASYQHEHDHPDHHHHHDYRTLEREDSLTGVSDQVQDFFFTQLFS